MGQYYIVLGCLLHLSRKFGHLLPIHVTPANGQERILSGRTK